MPIYDDPKLAGYKPVAEYQEKDMDRSSRRIRDMPYGRRKESGMLGPSEMNFGILGINDISPAQTAVLHNNGYDDLPINGMTIVGDFVITTDCGASLLPGESCQISVQFNPKREGLLTGGIYVDTGDAAGAEFIKLRGSGELSDIIIDPPLDAGAEASFAPAFLAFGEIETTFTSAVQSVVLTNIGDETMTISSIVVPSHFTLTNTPATSLAAGASTTISVEFSPTVLGALTANLTVNHTGTGATNVVLSGTGIADIILPVISISDATLEEVLGASIFAMPASPLSLGSVLFGETATSVFYLTGSSTGEISMTALPASGLSYTFGYSTSVSGPFIPQTSFVIPLSGRMYVQASVAGVAGTYSQIITFSSATQTETMTVNAVIAEEVIVLSMPRIRIAGNQFYKAVDETDLGGALPAEGGVRLASCNWFGAEGTNQAAHGTWIVPWRSILDQIKLVGFNTVRIPFSGDTAQNPAIPSTAIDADINPDLVGLDALDFMDLIVSYCEAIELYVVFDHHRRTAGAGADGAPTDGSYTQADWLATWGIMATRYADSVNVVGADVHNEPHDLTWEAWATAAEACGNHILTIASDWLIFIEGVGNIGDSHYWWGGQLEGVRTRPCTLSVANRVVYSPHEYGQSVGSQTWQKKDGNIPVNWPLNQAAIWDQFWGYIFYEEIAPLWIGEMGGHFGLDASTGALTEPHRIEETEWMSHLVRYLDWDENTDGTVSTGEAAANNGGKQGISFAWWSWNPNSGDTGGLVQGDWTTLQAPKINLIQTLLD
jgi:aryl-phospho-beta-D-glucosidase BglC (GH1 family)